MRSILYIILHPIISRLFLDPSQAIMTPAPTTTVTQADVPALLDQMTGAARHSVIASDSVSVPQLLQCLVDRGILAHPPPPPQQQPPALDTETLMDQASAAWTLLAKLTIENEDDADGTAPRSDAMRASASTANEELHHRLAIVQGALMAIQLTASAGPAAAAAAPGRLSDLRLAFASACAREPIHEARLGRLQRRRQVLREDCAEMARQVVVARAAMDLSRARMIRRVTAALEDVAINAATDTLCDAVRDAKVSIVEWEKRAQADIEAKQGRLRMMWDEASHVVERIGQLQADLDRLAILRIVVARMDAGMA